MNSSLIYTSQNNSFNKSSLRISRSIQLIIKRCMLIFAFLASSYTLAALPMAECIQNGGSLTCVEADVQYGSASSLTNRWAINVFPTADLACADWPRWMNSYLGSYGAPPSYHEAVWQNDLCLVVSGTIIAGVPKASTTVVIDIGQRGTRAVGAIQTCKPFLQDSKLIKASSNAYPGDVSPFIIAVTDENRAWCAYESAAQDQQGLDVDQCCHDGANTMQPITPATGEKQLFETDWLDAGAHPLHIRRVYRSYGGSLKPYSQVWSHSILPTLSSSAYSARVTLPSGNVRNFSRAASGAANTVWLTRAKPTDSLTQIDAQTLIYSDGDTQEIYTFDASYRLQSVSQRNGWTMHYSYNSAGQISQITNHFGRSLQLAYNSAGQLSQITTPDAQNIRYDYNAQGSLSSVALPDGKTRLYQYGISSFAHLLTSVIDENAQLLSSYSYDSFGRAIETTKQGGVDRFQVNYGSATGNQISSATITDPLGTARTYNYATNLSQLAVTLSDKPSSHGLRDAYWRVQDSLGFVAFELDFQYIYTTYEWDTTRRLKTSETRAAGRPEQQTTSITWHPTFRLPTQIIEQGATGGAIKTTNYTYDSLGNLLTQTETDSTGSASSGQTRTYSYTYNSSSQMTAMTDARSQVWAFTYDAQGNRASSTNPLGHITSNTFDGAGRMLTETAPNGLVTSYQYDARGRVTRITRGSNLAAAQQQATIYTYTPSGQIATAALPNGHAITYSYDAAQRLTSATDNRGNSIQYTLDPMGNRISETVRDAGNQIALSTQRVINSLNRVEAIRGGSNPAQQTTAFQYDANGELIKSIDPLSNTTETFLDPLRRPIATKLPDGAQADSYYNQLNQLTQATDPKGIATQYSRNAWGEVLSETSPDIGSTSYTRDAGGNVLSMTDAKSQTSSYQYDALSRVTNITFADGKQQNFFYDGTAAGQQKGHLREMQDSSGNTKYERDAFGRITKKTQTVLDNISAPTVLISQYTYDKAELASIRYPSGLTVAYPRNASGQISGITTKIGSAATLPFVQNLQYTALEQPKAWNWAHCTTASVALPGSSTPCTAASRSFDADGRMSSSSIASYQFDSNSRITGITQNLYAQRSVSSTPTTGTSTATITTTQLYQQPISWTIGYDNRDRITSFARIFSGSGQQAASTESFTYDPNSNRLSSISINATDTDKDGLYEFSEQRKNTTRLLSIQPTSNKLQGFAQTLTTLTGTRTNSTVASQINYTLDANGNLTSDGLRDFQYDAENRLSKVILGSTFVGTDSIAGNELAQHSYLHNAAGQRVFKSEPKTETTVPSSTTLGTGFVDWLRTNFSWLWATAQTNATLGDSYNYADGNIPSWALLGEYGNGGATSTGRTEYIWLPTADGSAIPIGLYRSGKLYAIHSDHLGTPRLMVDNANQPVWQWAYSAFGDNAPTGVLKPTTNAGSAFISMPGQGTATATLLAVSNPTQINNLRFPGQYADSETGLFYNYFRTYQPNQGRYTQPDPIGLDGGWNQFGYVYGNPLSWIDPEGLVGLYNDGSVNVNAYPGPPAGGNEHARAGAGQNYHVHVRDSSGREVRMSTETWKPLTPQDQKIYDQSKAIRNFCDGLSPGEKKFFDRVNRQVFHTGYPTVNQTLRLGGWRGRSGGRSPE
jgi:RHS repeat-associated protein